MVNHGVRSSLVSTERTKAGGGQDPISQNDREKKKQANSFEILLGRWSTFKVIEVRNNSRFAICVVLPTQTSQSHRR